MWWILQLLIAVVPAPDLPLSAAERLAWERELLRAHRAGDPQAFAALYRAYAATLYARVLLPLLRSPALAEDALADCFARAHVRLREFQASDRSVYYWLSRIARNRALDMQRHHSVQRRAAAALRGESAPGDDPEALLVTEAERATNARRIEQVLARLTPRYRRAIELRFFDDHPRDVCAERLEIKLATFDVLLLRALSAFRREWSRT